MSEAFDYHKELIRCYSDQAEHFHNTRKKFWPEVDLLNNELLKYCETLSSKKVTLVDLWCWSWRLSEQLNLSSLTQEVEYLWVDNAPWMIDIAKSTYPWSGFVCTDLITFTNDIKQESIDFLIALASIQHIQWTKKQQELLLWIYRSLKWWGKVVLINRSFSNWFIGKYWKNIISALRNSFIKKGRSRNDLFVLRKDKSYHINNISYKRMYHIYTLHELKKLCKLCGFVIEKSWYIYQDWSFGDNWKNSRNSVLVLTKTIG